MKLPMMNNCLLLPLLLLFVSTTQAGEIAGRVLVAVGEVSAIRQGQETPLTSGASVESGDRIVTGAESNAQIRFSDESIVALRPKTEFRIDDYYFAPRSEVSSRGFFSLLRGGFRTLTGAIGKLNRDSYRINAQAATIGIRGTHYSALLCLQQSCVGDDGQVSPDGLYGGVLDGRIRLDNQGGVLEFGRDEFFYVADANTLPIRLIAPPSFLRDRLEGQVRRKTTPGTAKNDKESGVKADRSSQTDSDSTVLVPGYVASENMGEDGSSLSISPQKKAVTIVTNGYDQNRNNQAEGGIIGPYGTSFSMKSGPGNTLTGYQSSYPSGNTFFAALGAATVKDAGSDSQAGNLNWGRWSGPGSHVEVNFGFPVVMEGPSLHYIYGDPATNLPISGIVSYKPSGWTTPTDTSGIQGQLLSGGTLSVNFATAVASLSGLTVGVSNAAYVIGGSASYLPNQGQFFHASTDPSSGLGTATLSCSGTNCNLSHADFLGVIVGSGGAGVGLSYGIHNTPNTLSGGNTNAVNGVVGYVR